MTSPTPENIRDAILKALDDGQAEGIVSIPVGRQTPLADYIVIASGKTGRQLSALADRIGHALKAIGARVLRIEGAAQGDWVLVDARDVIVHLFRPDVRNFYKLEKVWTPPQGEAETEPADKA